ncbi:DUF4384 domain-containing protein [Bradyrhizobium sp. 21]|uniref:DUF4384 domain-containing protein n=1 Tax=Bradyrhizobium sp. 21 TaxID=2782666 RepID=UPI001FF9E406|nr:DUF4384 domain-containing protein [Bradyrhizobium sp. 21]MCK1386636.1 DUF4384 domain-containing protein [Bradyrhizobium sp. 21]
MNDLTEKAMSLAYPRRRGVWLVGGAVLLAALSVKGWAAEGDEARQITVQQAPLLNLTAPASTLGVDVWTNRADGTYAIDEDLTLFVRTSYDASVTILNVDAAGHTTMLFPNRFAPDNLLRGNRVYQVPSANAKFKLNVGGPAGVNLIKVFATTDKAPILKGRAVEQSGPFDTYKDSSDEIARQVQVVMTKQPGAVWATADRPIRVVARQLATVPPQILPIPAPDAPPTVVGGNPSPAESPAAGPPGSPAPGLLGLSGSPSSFGLQLRTTKASYRMGDELALTVTPERSCKLTLLSVDAQNNATVLYPNRLEKELSLRAGQTSFLPGSDAKAKLALMGQPGLQTVVAVCSEEWSLAGSIGNLFKFDDRSIYPTLNNQVNVGQAIAAQLKSGRKVAYTSATFLLTQ